LVNTDTHAQGPALITADLSSTPLLFKDSHRYFHNQDSRRYKTVVLYQFLLFKDSHRYFHNQDSHRYKTVVLYCMSIDSHALPDFLHPSPPHPLQWEVVYPAVFVNDVKLVVNRISMQTRSPHTNLINALYLLRYFWQMGIYVHQEYLASHLFPLANLYLAEISSSISPLPDSKFVLLSSQNGHVTFVLFERFTLFLNNPQHDGILATQHRLVPTCTPHDFSVNVLGIFSPPIHDVPKVYHDFE